MFYIFTAIQVASSFQSIYKNMFLHALWVLKLDFILDIETDNFQGKKIV